MNYRYGTIRTGVDFPLKSGEVLRIRLGGTRELRVLVAEQTQTKPPEFGTRLHYHQVGTNKDTITMVGNERKLRKV